MKTMTPVLGAGVIALTGMSAYLTWQLGIERSRAEQAEARVAQMELRLKKVERAPVPAPAAVVQTSIPTAPSTAPVANRQHEKDTPPPDAAAGDIHVRRHPIDRSASTRALRRAEWIDRLKSQSPGLGRVLGMSESEVNDFIAFLADQQMREQDAFSKNPPQPNPIPGGPQIVTFDFAASQEQQKREQIERLGEERWQKYETYRKGAPDRQQVQGLRNRLSDSSAMSDALAESLALALQDDREQYLKQLKAEIPNATFTTSGASGRMLMTNISPSDEDGQEKQLIEQLETYNKRAHDRAEALLTPQQLKAFDEMQESQFTRARMMIRSMRETVPAK